MNRKEFWLITTDHLEDRLLFKDAEDFRVGMNYVAVQVHKKQVAVLVFILMSNHLHFILYCTREEAEWFMNDLKKEYSKYLRKKYGSREHLRGNGVDIRLIPLENEALERALAYVQMNCVAANICGSPGDYPWGTGNCFFQVPMVGKPDSPRGTAEPGSRPLAGIKDRERYRLLHSKADLPGEWLMSESGYILPSSYVRKDLVENAFRSPKRMNYFLANSSKARKRIQTIDDNLPSFRDQTIVNALPDLCRSLFNKNSFKELKEDEQAEFVQQIRYRFSADANQIARTCEIPYDRAACLLQSFH